MHSCTHTHTHTHTHMHIHTHAHTHTHTHTHTSEVSSAPASFTNNQTKYSIKAIPGKPCPMGIRTYDDSRKDSTNRTILNVVSHSPNIAVTNSSLYISDDLSPA